MTLSSGEVLQHLALAHHLGVVGEGVEGEALLHDGWKRASERPLGDQEVHLEHVDGGDDRDVAAEQPYLGAQFNWIMKTLFNEI